LKKYCQNCYHPLPYKAKFCAHCGQKASDGKVPVSDVMQQLWFRILHLESRSWRVLWRLFVPGQVSLDYFGGKRKRYPPPVQFFFVIMFFFLFLLNHTVGNGGFHVRKMERGYNIGYNSDKSQSVDLYQIGNRYWKRQQFRSTLDSLPPEYRTPQIRAGLDSLLRRADADSVSRFEKVFERSLDSPPGSSLDSLTFLGGYRSVKIASKDIFLLEPEAIIRHYSLAHWFDKLLIRQGVKSLKEPSAMVRTFLGSLAWTFLAQVTLMAAVLTLLYLRRQRYYVEHFIFLLHEHTSAILALTVIFSVHQFYPLPPNIWIVFVSWLVLASVISMRRYYQQNWMKTLVKWSIFSLIYFASFIILFIGGILVAFLVF
jgi:hypothetical protein